MTPQQADHARNVLRVGIAKANTNPTKLAYDIGRKRDYIRDFLKGRKESLGASDFIELERVLGITRAQLLGGSPVDELTRVPLGSEFDDDEVFDDTGQIVLATKAKQTLGPGEVPERNVIAGLGQGGIADPVNVDGEVLDGVRAIWRLPVSYLRTELRARESEVDIVAVDGDSMIPTLQPGDRVLINRSQRAPSPDGLYAIFDGVGVAIKRLELLTGSKPLKIRIISDNSQHGSHEILAEDLNIIGRVIMRMSRL